MFKQLNGRDSRITETKLSLMKEFTTEITAVQAQINEKFDTTNEKLHQVVIDMHSALQSFKTQQAAENTKINDKIKVKAAEDVNQIKTQLNATKKSLHHRYHC